MFLGRCPCGRTGAAVLKIFFYKFNYKWKNKNISWISTYQNFLKWPSVSKQSGNAASYSLRSYIQGCVYRIVNMAKTMLNDKNCRQSPSAAFGKWRRHRFAIFRHPFVRLDSSREVFHFLVSVSRLIPSKVAQSASPPSADPLFAPALSTIFP